MNDGTIKIRLTASPVEGKANEALIAFLSKLLDLNVTKFEIVAGLTGREKLITIMDISPEEVHQKIISSMA